MGAPSRDGLAGAEAPEPHAGLGPTDGIPSAFSGLHPTHQWEPYLYVGDGYKAHGFRRADGAGYVIPVFDDGEWKMTDRWWVTFAHPMMCGRPGWHHHAFGTYSSAKAGAFAFDKVYALECAVGNTDRMTRADASGTSGSA
jgi:hypothetical protein